MNTHRIGTIQLARLGLATSAFLALALTIAIPPARAAGAEATAAAVTPDQALQQLMAGNARFMAHQPKHPNQDAARVTELAAGQHPIAVVLSCSDSRVPPEVVFDQGLGDVFTVRVAGNVTNAEVLGSIEYAVEHLGSPLIVVMGHQKCGAVTAALAGGEAGGHVQSIVNDIAPVIAEAKKSATDPLDAAVRLNVRHVVGELESSEPILAHEVKEGKVKVVGAYYSLDTGKVTMLSAAPATAAPAKPAATAH